MKRIAVVIGLVLGVFVTGSAAWIDTSFGWDDFDRLEQASYKSSVADARVEMSTTTSHGSVKDTKTEKTSKGGNK